MESLARSQLLCIALLIGETEVGNRVYCGGGSAVQISVGSQRHMEQFRFSIRSCVGG